MVIQYPHIMIVPVIQGGDATQDADGNLIPSQTINRQQACRYEPLTRIKEVSTSDGNIVYSRGTVLMPLSAIDIPQGTMIEIPGVIRTPVLYFYRGQLNCTMNL